jgi:hypothetical protein
MYWDISGLIMNNRKMVDRNNVFIVIVGFDAAINAKMKPGSDCDRRFHPFIAS